MDWRGLGFWWVLLQHKLGEQAHALSQWKWFHILENKNLKSIFKKLKIQGWENQVLDSTSSTQKLRGVNMVAQE